MSGAGGQAGGKKGGRDRRREGKSGRSGRSDQRWPGMLRACRAPRPVSGAEEVRYSPRSGARAAGWGPGRGAEAQYLAPFPPSRGCRGRWGTLAAQDARQTGAT